MPKKMPELGDRMSEFTWRLLPPLHRAAALIFASAIALATTPLLAKHAAPQGDSDAESQQAPAPADASAAGRGTTIKGQFVESHDLLSDSGDPSQPVSSGIQWTHNFTIALSGRNHVSEQWNNVRSGMGASNENRARSSGEHKRAQPHLIRTGGESSVTIGSTTGKAVWHVLGDKKLQRIFPGQHFLMIMNIEVGADNACSLEVKYLRQEGFTSVVMRQATNGMMSNFSLPHVESASCTIE